MRRLFMILAAATLLACGGAEPSREESTVDDTTEPEAEATADPVPATDPTPAADPPPNGELAVRLALVRAQIPAMTSPMSSEDARLEATLFVRGAAGTSVTTVVPMAHELDWVLTAGDGTRWEPMFLPPPMPRPGGPPTTTVTIPDSGETQLGTVHGISGFRHPGNTDWQEGLPAGTYEVRVSGFDLGEGARRDAPPVTLTVR